ncbi:hypothetical protein ABPG73_008968, partial [Tetrahymena malaccensis]
MKRYVKKIKNFTILAIPNETLIKELRWNTFTKKGCKVLGFSISKCHNLQNLELDLVDCKIGSQGATSMGSYLSNCINLKNVTLCLEGNLLGACGLSDLCDGFSKCPKLINLTLYLQKNEIGSSGVSILGSAIQKFTKIINLTLIFDFNKIESIGIQDLAHGLANCTILKNLTLNLDFNQIESIGIQDLAHMAQLKSKKPNSQSAIFQRFIFQFATFKLSQAQNNTYQYFDKQQDLLNLLNNNINWAIIFIIGHQTNNCGYGDYHPANCGTFLQFNYGDLFDHSYLQQYTVYSSRDDCIQQKVVPYKQQILDGEGNISYVTINIQMNYIELMNNNCQDNKRFCQSNINCVKCSQGYCLEQDNDECYSVTSLTNFVGVNSANICQYYQQTNINCYNWIAGVCSYQLDQNKQICTLILQDPNILGKTISNNCYFNGFISECKYGYCIIQNAQGSFCVQLNQNIEQQVAKKESNHFCQSFQEQNQDSVNCAYNYCLDANQNCVLLQDQDGYRAKIFYTDRCSDDYGGSNIIIQCVNGFCIDNNECKPISGIYLGKDTNQKCVTNIQCSNYPQPQLIDCQTSKEICYDSQFQQCYFLNDDIGPGCSSINMVQMYGADINGKCLMLNQMQAIKCSSGYCIANNSCRKYDSLYVGRDKNYKCLKQKQTTAVDCTYQHCIMKFGTKSAYCIKVDQYNNVIGVSKSNLKQCITIDQPQIPAVIFYRRKQCFYFIKCKIQSICSYGQYCKDPTTSLCIQMTPGLCSYYDSTCINISNTSQNLPCYQCDPSSCLYLNNQCIKITQQNQFCVDNNGDPQCNQCYYNQVANQHQCLKCNQGYALHYNSICYKCPDNCDKCIFGGFYNQNSINWSEFQQLYSIEFLSKLTFDEYSLRCTICKQGFTVQPTYQGCDACGQNCQKCYTDTTCQPTTIQNCQIEYNVVMTTYPYVLSSNSWKLNYNVAPYCQLCNINYFNVQNQQCLRSRDTCFSLHRDDYWNCVITTVNINLNIFTSQCQNLLFSDIYNPNPIFCYQCRLDISSMLNFEQNHTACHICPYPCQVCEKVGETVDNPFNIYSALCKKCKDNLPIPSIIPLSERSNYKWVYDSLRQKCLLCLKSDQGCTYQTVTRQIYGVCGSTQDSIGDGTQGNPLNIQRSSEINWDQIIINQEDLTKYLVFYNEMSVEYIDVQIIINQNECRLYQNIQIKTNIYKYILGLQRFSLTITNQAQSQTILESSQSIQISGFTHITFQNIQMITLSQNSYLKN